MKNYDIERILKPAFKLFLTYNYEAVTTTKLEEETGLTRGAIFFKHKTKEALFKAVIDNYIISFQSSSSKIQANSLKEFIELFLNGVEMRMKELQQLGITNLARGYFNLLYQAVQYYPSFSDTITAIFNNSINEWECIISKAKESGEIKPTCDVHSTALKFRYVYSGMSFEYSFDKRLDINKLRELFDKYYAEINNE